MMKGTIGGAGSGLLVPLKGVRNRRTYQMRDWALALTNLA